MLAFVINRIDFENSIKEQPISNPKYVCIGSFYTEAQVKKIADTFHCITNIKVINNCVFVVCD